MQNFSALSAYSDSVLSQSLSLTRWAHPIQSLIQSVWPMVIPGATQESNKNPSQTGLQQIRCWGLLLLLNCHCIHFIDESWSVCQIDLSQRADAKVAHWCGPLVILQHISKFTMLQHTHVLLSRLGKHQAYDHMQPRFWTWDDHSGRSGRGKVNWSRLKIIMIYIFYIYIYYKDYNFLKVGGRVGRGGAGRGGWVG